MHGAAGHWATMAGHGEPGGGTGNDRRVYPVHRRDEHVHVRHRCLDLVGRARANAVVRQMFAEHFGTVRKVRGTDEYVHGLKVGRLALLAILRFKLDSDVVDAKAFLNSLFVRDCRVAATDRRATIVATDFLQ